MSLYEVADGLLGTHVTWMDIEQDMQKALNTNAIFGENKKITLIGDKIYMSKVGLIKPDWKNGKSDEQLPKQFVVKIASQLSLITLGENFAKDEESSVFDSDKLSSMAQMTFDTHNREVDMYMNLKESNEDIKCLKTYTLHKFTETNQLKGYIICDYIPNIYQIPFYELLSFDEVLPVFNSISNLVVLGQQLKMKQKAIDEGINLIEKTFYEFFDQETLDNMIISIGKQFPDEYKTQSVQLMDTLRLYSSRTIIRKYGSICEFLGHEKVLTHGDLWTSNMIFSKTDGHIQLESIIDWQTVSWTGPGNDIARILLSDVHSNTRREKKQELIETYYDNIMKKLKDQPIPFTLEQLFDSYHLYFPVLAILGCNEMSRINELDEIHPGNEKVKNYMMDHYIKVMEDVIEQHNYNLQNYPTFFES